MSNEEQQRYLDNITVKAETLIEALPYIRDFNSKKVVVKYGGSAMLDHNLEESVIKDVALLKLVGMQPIIVHGGGKEISKWISKVGKETRFEEGFRVTDKDTMEVVSIASFSCNGSDIQDINGKRTNVINNSVLAVFIVVYLVVISA